MISYSGLWCRPDLKILFVKRPYLWSVESLAGSEADEPSNSHLPLKRARGSVRFTVFKAAPLSTFPRLVGRCPCADINGNMSSVAFTLQRRWFRGFPQAVNCRLVLFSLVMYRFNFLMVQYSNVFIFGLIWHISKHTQVLFTLCDKYSSQTTKQNTRSIPRAQLVF